MVRYNYNKKNGVFVKKFWKKTWKKNWKKKIWKNNFGQKYFETKKFITEIYKTINQCDNIFALPALIEQGDRGNRKKDRES